MAKRKTVSLESIKLKANHYFTTSKNEATLQRRTLQFFVTDLLMDAGQYQGFNYLRKHDVENGLTYGVEWNDTGDKVTFKDESRIFFYWTDPLTCNSLGMISTQTTIVPTSGCRNIYFFSFDALFRIFSLSL